jgi:hypothetical protein
MLGCHREGRMYVFDNNHTDGMPQRGLSSVSCENAKYNWFKMPIVITYFLIEAAIKSPRALTPRQD